MRFTLGRLAADLSVIFIKNDLSGAMFSGIKSATANMAVLHLRGYGRWCSKKVEPRNRLLRCRDGSKRIVFFISLKQDLNRRFLAILMPSPKHRYDETRKQIKKVEKHKTIPRLEESREGSNLRQILRGFPSLFRLLLVALPLNQVHENILRVKVVGQWNL